ncbi:DUF899 family protein [Streptomyces sp. NPDC005355]|uniref:DUF899 family protein n=1 Tax=Streptomyces sp. NPDC005355 TaxID=3157038 RepID=UPI0033AC9E3D
MRVTNLGNESAEYTAAREELSQAEADLVRRREHVAELKRGLPEGPIVEDYLFHEGPTELAAGDTPVREVRLSELFTGPGRPLMLYHFMFGKEQDRPCPGCTMSIDGFNGVAHHLAGTVDFAVVAAADLPTLRAHARERDWSGLRLLSAAPSNFKYDLGSENSAGDQDATLSVFTRDEGGAVRHFYSTRVRMADGDNQQATDLLSPIWHLLDLAPQGRGEWYPRRSY